MLLHTETRLVANHVCKCSKQCFRQKAAETVQHVTKEHVMAETSFWNETVFLIAFTGHPHTWSQLPVKNVTCCFAMLAMCYHQTAQKESHGNLFLDCNINHNYHHDGGKAWISVFILCWTLVYATCKTCITEKVLRTAAWPTESKARLFSQYQNGFKILKKMSQWLVEVGFFLPFINVKCSVCGRSSTSYFSNDVYQRVCVYQEVC